MVLWDGLGQAATIAQLAGVDAYGLIKMIVEAARTVKRNRETCQNLAGYVKMIGDLLQRLQSTELMQHPETRKPVEKLEETLRKAYMVIASCQKSSYLHSCFMGGKQADKLHEVQYNIASCLQLFLLVSLVDTTRSWKLLLNRAHPFCTEDITDELHTVHHSEDEITDELHTVHHSEDEITDELHTVHHSEDEIRFSTDVLEATELGDQGVSQSPEVFEEKQDEKTERAGLSLSQILAATNNFSGRSLIGKGGFGSVYKGKLSNGLEIAVKRHDTSLDRGEAAFMSEIDVIPKLRQKNIIELLGFYSQGKERILVYEYASNGSLDSIFGDETKRTLLDWSKRLKIIEGMADGLLYLHNHSIVHMDIKPSNILLDHEMNAKISDFGLARKLAPNATAEKLLSVCGTWGYADPEYLATGIISDKTDVYSFGIVLLEIISGRLQRFSEPTLGNLDSNLREEIYSRMFPEFALKNRKKLHELIDPSLVAKKLERAQIRQCLKVAMWCVHHRAEDRPNMSEVVTMLPHCYSYSGDESVDEELCYHI